MTTKGFISKHQQCLCLTCAGFAWLCIIVLFIAGMVVVDPYRVTSRFEESTCLVHNITDLGRRRCAGLKPVKKGYDCYKVFVTRGDGEHGILYSEAYDLDEFSCSHHDCGLTSRSMGSFIRKYRQKLKRQELFACYYDQDDPSTFVPEIKYSSSDVLHSMLWPSLFFVIAVLCVALLCRQITNPGTTKKYERGEQLTAITKPNKEQAFPPIHTQKDQPVTPFLEKLP